MTEEDLKDKTIIKLQNIIKEKDFKIKITRINSFEDITTLNLEDWIIK